MSSEQAMPVTDMCPAWQPPARMQTRGRNKLEAGSVLAPCAWGSLLLTSPLPLRLRSGEENSDIHHTGREHGSQWLCPAHRGRSL